MLDHAGGRGLADLSESGRRSHHTENLHLQLSAVLGRYHHSLATSEAMNVS